MTPERSCYPSALASSLDKAGAAEKADALEETAGTVEKAGALEEMAGAAQKAAELEETAGAAEKAGPAGAAEKAEAVASNLEAQCIFLAKVLYYL